jgi:hypothetical protein
MSMGRRLEMPRVALDSLGCKLNQAEIELLARQLAEAGYRLVASAAEADIYILNTKGLQSNTYRQFPLHFVDNTTRRLIDLYSILVIQQAISPEAFTFWDQLRMNNVERGGLYETQPLPVKGNMYNLTKPEQAVLGYFQVASVKTKRLFIRNVPDLELIHPASCGVYILKYGLREFTPVDYPVYLLNFKGAFLELTEECIFCTRMGGTTVKPDFWPE